MDGYLTGNMEEDAKSAGRNGWIVGSFLPSSTLQHSVDLEVKYWSFQKGIDPGRKLKTSSTTEWTYLLKGKVLSIVDNKQIILTAGDYVLIHPEVSNNLIVEVLEDAVGITVKAPSVPSAKKIIED